MRILIATGSFKGTLSSSTVAQVVGEALRAHLPRVTIQTVLLADGGEGTIEVFEQHFGAQVRTVDVHGPLGEKTAAKMGVLGSTWIIESSQAIGLSLVRPDKLRPRSASSRGVGELIRHAVAQGATEIIVTMGDSATMDLGIGMLGELGVRFQDCAGQTLAPVPASLSRTASLDISALDSLRHVHFAGLVDTDDVLCGPSGQVQLYGRQKGLSDTEIIEVEADFLGFAEVIKRSLGADVVEMPFATGSGGLAAAMRAFLAANLTGTLEYLASRTKLIEQMYDADLIITGEGRLDAQTKFGKIPYFIAKNAKCPCVALVGSYTKEGLQDMREVNADFSVLSLNPEYAMAAPGHALRSLAEALAFILGSAG